MEFFPDGLVVRLRSRTRGGGLYLYARDDGVGVAVSPRRSSPNTGWEVGRFQREGTATDCFVLGSSATGRCLAAAEGEESSSAADQRSRRRAAAVQGLQFQRASRWRATRAGLRHGEVILILRDSFGRKLCAEAEARHGNGVFIDLLESTKNGWTGPAASASHCHWFVEAALPLPLLPPPELPATVTVPRCTTLYVPRLSPATASSARLPVLGTGNDFLGYLPACCVAGLLELVDGTCGGEMLQVQADPGAVVDGEGRNAEQQLLMTALAFVAGRGKGITTLPLHLQLLEQDQDDASSSLVLDGHDDGQPSANDDVDPEPAGNLVDQRAEAALEEQAEQQANAEAVGRQPQDDHSGDDVAQKIEDTLSLLNETYELMEKKHRSISRHVEQKRVTAEEAADRRDWSDVGKTHRTLQKKIQSDITLYDTKEQEAARLRDSLVRLGVGRPPSPPPLLRRHPAHLLPRRRG